MIKLLAQLIIVLVLLAGTVLGQERKKLSLQEAYSLLEARYPYLNNSEDAREAYQLQLKQLDKARLPMIYLKADGRLQSESVRLDAEGVQLPFEIDRPLYSLSGYLESRYLLLDGGASRARKIMAEAHLKSQLQEGEVEKYSLRERINKIFLGIKMLRAQAGVLEISRKDLEARRARLKASVEEGVVLESELKKLEVKAIELETARQRLGFEETALLESLAYFLGEEVAPGVVLELPKLPSPLEIPTLKRPEQRSFSLKREALLAQSRIIDASRRPTLALFVQGGLGYPNPLNILETNLAPYGIVGAQFSWKIVDWNKSRVDKEVLGVQARKMIQAERNFEFNMNAREAEYKARVARLLYQIQKDEEIAALQAEILKQMSAQLDEGVITSSDYLIQLNEELLARQNLLIHQLELQAAQLEYWNHTGTSFK